jgi:hypothetical protein
MVVSFIIALYFQFIHPMTNLLELSSPIQLVLGVCMTTMAWITVTLITKPSDERTLLKFYNLIRPGGPGWKKFIEKAKEEHDLIKENGRWEVPTGILCMVFGCFSIYGALLATGYWIYGNYMPAVVLTLVAFFATVLLFRFWSKLRAD